MSDSEPNHILDQIEAYLSDGLSPGERLAFETHAANCGVCAEALAEARRVDTELRHMFQVALPAAGFEDKIIRRLRGAAATRRPLLHRPLLHPMALRSAAAVAAAVLLCGTGVVVSSKLNGEPLTLAAISGPREKIEYNRHPTYQSQGIAWGETKSETALGSWGSSHERRPSNESLNSYSGLRLDEPAIERLQHHLGRGESNGPTKEAKLQITSATDGTWSLGTSAGTGQAVQTFRPEEVLRRQLGDKAQKLGDSNTLYYKPAFMEQHGDLGGVQAASPNWGYGVAPSGRMAGLGIDPAQEGKPVTGAAPAKPGDADGDGLKDVVKPAAAPAAPDNPPADANPAAGRKIIRNGTLEFEVERFDDALLRITKLVNEQGGFVATTDSDKLPNGKMKGTVTLRVAPEHLDTLVLTLRGIGDLKSQKIAAEDVTKHYTDLESQLRAAQAMYDRLLDIIKTGKGQVKDLVEAEKQLGIWTEKIEQLKGEQKYLDNLIGFSTLVIQLYEKDIKTPASVSETEQVAMSLETEKVDENYGKAIDAIKAAKGRIVQSELKQYDAGQLGATIQAAIPPDAAEQVIARLRQLDGRIAHFSRDRSQKTQDGTAAPAEAVRVRREDLVLTMQIYNLANIAPRRVITTQLAAAAVDKAYQQAIEQIRAAGGRIVTSSLAKPDANAQAADIEFQVPSEKADLLLDTIRTYGEVMRQDLSENPDTANVTEAKRGFHLRIVSLAAVPARETQTVQLAAEDVPRSFTAILDAVKAADGRILQSDLSQQNPQDITGTMTFEISRSAAPAVTAAIDKSAQLLTRAANRSADVENTVDGKLRLTLTLVSADRLPPRQTTSVREEVSDVERAVDDLVNAANSAGGRRIGSGDMKQDRNGQVTADVTVDVPLSKAGPILDRLEQAGYRRSKQVAFDNTVPEGPLARARIEATFSNAAAALGGEETTWDAIRHGLGASGKGLRWSLQMLVIGFCFVAPWALVLWALWRLLLRRRPHPSPPPAPTTAPPHPS